MHDYGQSLGSQEDRILILHQLHPQVRSQYILILHNYFWLQSSIRLHPPPKKDKFEELKHCAKARGWLVDTSSNKSLADSLDR